MARARWSLAFILSVWCAAASVRAQSATFTSDVLRDLPIASNLFALLETTQAELVTDRFNSGGLNAGEISRISGPLASWSQTRFRLGEVDITSANGGPLLFPDIAFLQQIASQSAAIPASTHAPGLTISLQPQPGSDQWRGSIEAMASSAALVAPANRAVAPPIERLHAWKQGNALLSGPLVQQRLRAVFAGAWSENATTERASHRTASTTRSLFANFVYTPASPRTVNALVWLQHAHAAGVRDTATHVQSTFGSARSSASSWRLLGGYTHRRRTFDQALVDGTHVDRLVDGPIPMLVADTTNITEQHGTVAWRAHRVHAKHRFDLGADATFVAAEIGPSCGGRIFESVDGQPARIWSFVAPTRLARRRMNTYGLAASDRVALTSRLLLDAHIRWESVAGSARGAAAGIVWHTLLPSAHLRWALGTRYRFSVLTGYTRAANQLRLDLLAFGDPAAPTAEVYRWDDQRPLVARVGPGTGDAPSFSRIDEGLRRSHSDEFAIAIASQPRSSVRLQVMGIARRQSPLIHVVNIGVPIDGYTSFTVPDANADLVRPGDDQQLRIFNRTPASFGRDRYLLTNPAVDAAKMGAVLVSAQVTTEHLLLQVGATAAAAVGAGGNRGFRASENDQDVQGELFTNPNASTFARGRVFNDRAYTIKLTTVYRLPAAIRIAAIARYQDGQPFSRLVIVPGLNQGVEAVQAFANGRSRFAFTGTLDLRLQKGFERGPLRLDAILDAYNVLNMRKEVEEYVVTGPAFRSVTAIQPPRAIHLGARLSF